MKVYNCIKRVKAAKIFRVDYEKNEVVVQNGDRTELTAHPVGALWLGKHRPQDGGYLVEYEDGYLSYSPADAFEKGYVLSEDDTFEASWAKWKAAGYQYGEDALTNVQFGWSIAKGLVKP